MFRSMDFLIIIPKLNLLFLHPHIASLKQSIPDETPPAESFDIHSITGKDLQKRWKKMPLPSSTATMKCPQMAIRSIPFKQNSDLLLAHRHPAGRYHGDIIPDNPDPKYQGSAGAGAAERTKRKMGWKKTEGR